MGRRFQLFLAAMCCPSFIRRVWAKQREVATRASGKTVYLAGSGLSGIFVGSFPWAGTFNLLD
jgi:hypothetical protein